MTRRAWCCRAWAWAWAFGFRASIPGMAQAASPAEAIDSPAATGPPPEPGASPDADRPAALTLPNGQSVRHLDGALQLLDARGGPLRQVPCADLRAERRGPPAWLAHHASRRSVVAAFPALGELWELALDPDAPPVFDGLVHDWRLAEAIAKPGWFTPRRVPLGLNMPARWWLDARERDAWPWVAGAFNDRLWIVHLDVRRVVAELPLRGAELQRAGHALHAGRTVWRVPTADGECWVDPQRWTRLDR